jgi:hypothetical protein
VYETAARTAPRLLFADVSDGTLRELGIDDQVLRAARSLVDKAQLEAISTLLPEDQLEVLQHLGEGFSPEEVYREVVAIRRPTDAPAEPVEDLERRIALLSGGRAPADGGLTHEVGEKAGAPGPQAGLDLDRLPAKGHRLYVSIGFSDLHGASDGTGECRVFVFRRSRCRKTPSHERILQA